MREEFGLVSAYHHHFGVPLGEELHPTFYMHRRQDRPFHIDYRFVPESWVERIMSAGSVATRSGQLATIHRSP